MQPFPEKKLLLIGALSIIFCVPPAAAQDVILKNGSIFSYEVKEFNETITLSGRVVVLQPKMNIDWKKLNKSKDRGSVSISPEALQSAVNILFSLVPSTEILDMMDQIPGFFISKKMYEDLKKTGKSKIRIDCGAGAESISLVSNEKFSLMISGTIHEVSALHLNFGEYKDDMWVLDDPSLPMVLKMKSMNQWELKEVN